MRYFIFTLTLLYISFMLTGCASNLLEKRRKAVLDCTKDLIEYNSTTPDAYAVCKDVYSSTKQEK